MTPGKTIFRWSEGRTLHWQQLLTSGYGPKKDKRTGSKTSPLRTPRIVRIARTAKKYLEDKRETGTLTTAKVN